MSKGKRLSHVEAFHLAREVISRIAYLCERIEIAGSIRRGILTVGDIEIVAIPCPVRNLLGELSYPSDQIRAVLSEHYIINKGGDLMQQYDLGPCHLDLFLTTPEKWGVIFTIRTGPAEFSQKLVTTRQKGGLLPSYLQVRDGRLWLRASGEVLETAEERDLFRTLGIEWIEPEER